MAGGYLVDSSIQDFRLKEKNPFEVQNNLLRHMGGLRALSDSKSRNSSETDGDSREHI